MGSEGAAAPQAPEYLIVTFYMNDPNEGQTGQQWRPSEYGDVCFGPKSDPNFKVESGQLKLLLFPRNFSGTLWYYQSLVTQRQFFGPLHKNNFTRPPYLINSIVMHFV